jgi:hypothetical protein
MARLMVLIILAGSDLVSCTSGHNLGDYVPVWAGGLPSNAPPRPGTPEYDAYRKTLEGEAARDKSKDPPKPKTDADATPIMSSQTPASPPMR